MSSTAKKMKVLVADPLGQAGMEILKADTSILVEEKTGLGPDQLKKVISDADAIVIRSGTHVTREVIQAAKRLKVIGRAGVGVDNVHLEEATKRGIIVMNTPEGNTISTAEHTFSMLMALARNIPQADQSLKKGEWKRQKFLGTELNGKVLGVAGFGRIGREVSKRAVAFGMKVAAFDPFISKESFKEYPVEFMDLKSLLKTADFITVHTPLTPETKYLLNEETLKLCKKGVKIINCARGGIIEEKALYEALKSGHVSAAALDVFEQEPPGNNPLLDLPQVIATPHLGAATQEAQENVAVDVAKQVLDALHEKAIKNAVNLPNLDTESYKVLRPWITLGEKIGSFYSQYFPGELKAINIRYGGEVTKYALPPLTNAVVKGFLAPICGETVNYVNAQTMAKERGIVINAGESTQTEDFTNYIEVAADTDKGHRITGTLFGNKFPRIVNIDKFWGLDIDPEGYILVMTNEDQPGVVGHLGTLLGNNNINIAEMSLARIKKGKKMLALTTLNTDNAVSDKVLTQIRGLTFIIQAKLVKL